MSAPVFHSSLPVVLLPPGLSYCQAIRIGDPNGAQRSGSIWERRGKGAERNLAVRPG